MVFFIIYYILCLKCSCLRNNAGCGLMITLSFIPLFTKEIHPSFNNDVTFTIVYILNLYMGMFLNRKFNSSLILIALPIVNGYISIFPGFYYNFIFSLATCITIVIIWIYKKTKLANITEIHKNI